MKVISPSFKILPGSSDSDNILKIIEVAGRTCYKSESNITEESSKKFVKNIVANGHESVLEHQTIIFKVGFFTWLKILLTNPKFLNLTHHNFRFIVSGNIRALRDYGKSYKFFTKILSFLAQEYPVIFDDFASPEVKSVKILSKHDLISLDEVLNHYTLSVRIICDRGVAMEITRHRMFSYSMESTRFVLYGNKHELIFIKPCFWDGVPDYATWFQACSHIEESYIWLTAEKGCKPQEARSILPNSLKTELVMTGNLKQWHHFFKLRAEGTTGKPHPQMLEITIPMLCAFDRMFPTTFGDIIIK
jgi:thymidylate synthase (FAD)